MKDKSSHREVSGDLFITRDNQDTYEDISVVSGRLTIAEGVDITFQNLTKVGIIEFLTGTNVDTPCLEECDLVYLRDGSVWKTPALLKLGSITADVCTDLIMPKLKQIYGNLCLNNASKLIAQNLEELNGDLIMGQGCVFHAPTLQMIKGRIRGELDASFNASRLTEIWGDIYLMGSVSFLAPKLSRVFGKINLWANDNSTNSPKTGAGGVIQPDQIAFYAPKLIGVFYTSGKITLTNVSRAECIMMDGHLRVPSLISTETLHIGPEGFLCAPCLGKDKRFGVGGL